MPKISSEFKTLKELQHQKELEDKIAIKKRNHVVKELKQQLKKEVMNVKTYEIQLKEIKIENLELKNREKRILDGLQYNLKTQSILFIDPGEKKQEKGGLPNQTPHNLTTTPHEEAVDSTTPHQEVNKALTQKLIYIQGEHHNLTRLVEATKEHMKLLEQDVLQKKEIIRNLVLRVENVASTEQSEQRVEEIFNKTTQKTAKKLFHKLEALLQETSIKNLQLLKDNEKLRSQAQQGFSQAQAQPSQAQAQPSQAQAQPSQNGGGNQAQPSQATSGPNYQELYEEVKDELELAEMAQKDSALLIENTEQIVRQQNEEIKQFQAQIKKFQSQIEQQEKLIQQDKEKILNLKIEFSSINNEKQQVIDQLTQIQQIEHAQKEQIGKLQKVIETNKQFYQQKCQKLAQEIDFLNFEKNQKKKIKKKNQKKNSKKKEEEKSC